jgi:predicted MPP superfamily phosphohydrolase
MDVASRRGKRVDVTRHEIRAPVARPLTVALLSDLHLNGEDHEVGEMLAILRRERPDVILLAGDLTSLDGNDEIYAAALGRLAAPLGVWMVPGNWDYWLPIGDLRGLCERAGARLLVNAAAEVAPGIWLAGLDDAVGGAPDARQALEPLPAEAWVMGLVHCPVGFDDLAGRCAVAFAGHTHGGQVRLPGLPPAWLPAGSGGYVAGWYERNGSRLYVSRGLGAKTLPVRLFCRPEVALFTLDATVEG